MLTSKVIRSAAVQGVRKLGSGKDELRPQHHRKGNTDRSKKDSENLSYSNEKTLESSLDSPVIYTDSLVSSEPEITKNMFNAVKEELAQKNKQVEQLQEELLHANNKTSDLELNIEAEKSTAAELGYSEGVLKANEKNAEKTEQIVRSIAAFSNQIQLEQNNINELAVEIALASLSKILGEDYRNVEFVQSVINNSAKSLRDVEGLKIHINELDYVAMQPYKDELEKSIGCTCEIVSDIRVAAGGCILETAAGSYDARLESQLQIIKDALINAMEAR